MKVVRLLVPLPSALGALAASAGWAQSVLRAQLLSLVEDGAATDAVGAEPAKSRCS